MEASHKARANDWKTLDNNHVYSIRGGFAESDGDTDVTRGPWIKGQEAADVGNYNALLKACPGYQYKDGEIIVLVFTLMFFQ